MKNGLQHMREEIGLAQNNGIQEDRSTMASYRQKYHLSPRKGWMNDPNGLIFYKGLYHAFYQHHPYSPQWGPMHWGHATSLDMVHWTHQPIALAPGDFWDKDGCFSGCAVDDNGVLSLIYTGHSWLNGVGNDDNIRQVQCLATSTDGIHFTKQGIVLEPPAGVMHFRDPKVWFQDGLWWMVLGVRDQNNKGRIYLYRGETLTNWTFDRALAFSQEDLGYMWECPDFFKIKDKNILVFSPQGIKAHSGYERRNRYQCGYLSGTWEPGTEFCSDNVFTELDHGHDFYAAQSFLAADGRRILMGWMDMWDSPMPSQEEGWSGSLTVPRELFLNSAGRVCMRPIVELQTLRKEEHKIKPISLNNTMIELDWIEPDCDPFAAELHLKWDQEQSTAERYGLRLGQGISLWFDQQSQRFILERFYPHLGLSGYRSVALLQDKWLSLQIFLDHSSIEVFINDGVAVLSSRIYPSLQDRKLVLFSDGGETMMVEGTYYQMDA